MSYTKQELTDVVKNSYSYAKILRKLNRCVTKNSHKYIKKKIQDLGLDTKHFDRHKRAKESGFYDKKHWSDILISRPSSCRQDTYLLRRSLIDFGREHKCEECGLKNIWNNKEITLQIDHINGVNNDDRPENLRFLCPNCHSQTKNFFRKKENHYCNCGKIKLKNSKACKTCNNSKEKIKQRKVKNRPPKEILLKEIKEMGYCATGRKYGVSDNAIRKWINAKNYQ